MAQPDQKTLAAYELMEIIRSYGSIVGTPGMSERNLELANDVIEKCLEALLPNVADQVDRLKATASTGIITN